LDSNNLSVKIPWKENIILEYSHSKSLYHLNLLSPKERANNIKMSLILNAITSYVVKAETAIEKT
jgi:hypothetical protein